MTACQVLHRNSNIRGGLNNPPRADAFVGNGNPGDILFYRNTGTADSPAFAAPSTNPFDLTNVGHMASPTFADIDGDGDLDAFVGNYDGNTLYYRNTGTAGNPVFAAPETNPFGLTDVGRYASPTTLVDIDGDGDLWMPLSAISMAIRCFTAIPAP